LDAQHVSHDNLESTSRDKLDVYLICITFSIFYVDTVTLCPQDTFDTLKLGVDQFLTDILED
jgi:hypothetical protein